MTDDDLLTPRPSSSSQATRAAILEATARRVRLDWRLRWAKRVGIGLVCFAAGVATTFLRPTPESGTRIVYIQDQSAPPNVEPPPVAPSRPASAAELELQAEQLLVKIAAARRFRDAGDRYLRDEADYSAALRCYRNFLDGADPTDLAVAPEDTWLLTSLKRAREQEKLP